MARIIRRIVNRLKRTFGVQQAYPGEISGDSFYDCIRRHAAKPDVKTILEIGSAAGRGSTAAFVEGMAQNPSSPTLHCMEVAVDRYEALRDFYRGNSQVRCYHATSVAPDLYATDQNVRDYGRLRPRWAPRYNEHEVLGWRQAELKMIAQQKPALSGIASVKAQSGIEYFDLVLIDGSEFTGLAELDQVYGARYILLDDIQVYKTHQCCMQLLADRDYRLAEADPNLRNGFAAFHRVALPGV